MKKTIIISLTLIFATLLTGCNGTQPVPTASGGKSKAATLSGNETEFMTGKFNFKFFSKDITIIGKDGATVTYAPTPKQPLTF